MNTVQTVERLGSGDHVLACDDTTMSFEWLLSPLDVKQFFSDKWNRSPLHIPGTANKFRALPGMKELPSLLGGKLVGDRWNKGHAHNAQASILDRSGRIRNVSAVPSMWPDLFNAGFSLCFAAVDSYDERLAALVRSFSSTTSLPGTIYVTSYLTPPFSGSAMHFDCQHAFFLQVSGTKHWRIGKLPAWEDAPANIPLSALNVPTMKAFFESIGVSVLSPEQTGIQEVTLNAGDVLYLPPGVWHEGRTSNSHSLHYTLTFTPLGPWQLIVAHLRRSYFANSAMRRDLRYSVPVGSDEATQLLESALEEIKRLVVAAKASDLAPYFMQVSKMDIPLRNQLLLP